MKKDTNPKYLAGIKKVPLHCIPTGPLFELGLAMLEGSRKYGRHNYRAIGVRASVYYDAATGHIIDWWEGEDIDPDSGVHHLIKAMACLLVVRDSMLMGNFNDDRPLRYPERHGRADFNEQVKKIVEKIPDCVPPFLEKDEKKFVCPEGWVIELNSQGPFRTGWYVVAPDNMRLRKNLTLHDNTGCGNYKFGEAPGYWPTKGEAEAALVMYLEKEK